MKISKKLKMLALVGAITIYSPVSTSTLKANAGSTVSRASTTGTGSRGFLSRLSDWWTSFKNSFLRVEFVNVLKKGSRSSSNLSTTPPSDPGDGIYIQNGGSGGSIKLSNLGGTSLGASGFEQTNEGFESDSDGVKSSTRSSSISSLGLSLGTDPTGNQDVDKRRQMLLGLTHDDEHMNGLYGTMTTGNGSKTQQ